MLVMRMVMAFRPKFYIPMSKAGLEQVLVLLLSQYSSPPIHYCPKVDENMHTAHKRDTFRKEKFHFRQSIFQMQERSQLELMNARAIFNGKVLYNIIDKFGG